MPEFRNMLQVTRLRLTQLQVGIQFGRKRVTLLFSTYSIL
jgi:hypothetical protein